MGRVTTTNIVGRTMDIAIYSSTDGAVSFEENAQLTGILKLANQFALILLTPLGTELTDPEFGSVLTQLTTSQGSTKVSEGIINIAVAQAANYIRKEQSLLSSLPADETLTVAKAIQIFVNKDTINLSVQITSLAGESVTVVLPVKRN